MCTTTSNIRDKIIESINHFSEIKQLEVKDEFVQEKLDQFFEQEENFRKFAKDYDQRLSTHADDLITFAESCEEDHITSDELLGSLKKLSDAKLNTSKSELINQLGNVKSNLERIINEITEYDDKITKEQTGWNNKINKIDKETDDAVKFAKGSVFIVGMAAIAAVPFTAGASLAVILPAKLIVTVSANLIVHGAATAVVSAAVAGASSIRSKFLNHELKDVRDQISRFLQEMQKGLEGINAIMSHCESHFEEQIAEIEEVEKIVDIFKKLDDRNGRQLIKPIARTISSRARKNSESYSVDMRQALKRDSGCYDCYIEEIKED